MAPLVGALAERAYVVLPVHPGFDGTDRPEWADSIADLAEMYLELLEQLDLPEGVLVIGSSIGGWVGVEMALRDNHTLMNGLVLLNSVGIEVPGHPVTDVRGLSPLDLGKLAFHNPALRPVPPALTDGQRTGMAANQRALAAYAGPYFSFDPKLGRRLRRVTIPVLAIWGEEDGIASLAYGRAYAGLFPRSSFVPVKEAGHFPHIERPAQTMAAIGNFVSEHMSRG
jgi:pimeloyl-ACP methyl ester carboxylesterase